MEDSRALPYRTTGEEIERFVEASARGRDLSQIRSLNFSDKSFAGTLLALQSFNLYDEATNSLTSRGKKFALASRDQRALILLEAILAYTPYELLLEAVFDRDAVESTTLDWIETWWSTSKYGSSPTNRTEASTSFARLIEYLDLGTYIQGRHGHSSRIEWKGGAAAQIKNTRAATKNTEGYEGQSEIEPRPTEEKGNITEAQRRTAASPDNSVLSLTLGNGRVAELSVPARLTKAEKERLVALVDLMIVVDDEQNDTLPPTQLSLGIE